MSCKDIEIALWKSTTLLWWALLSYLYRGEIDLLLALQKMSEHTPMEVNSYLESIFSRSTITLMPIV